MSSGPIFPPGATIGVMGGGQLGRMFAIAARRMGYRIHTFSPEEDSPTGQLADLEVNASFDDQEAVSRFAQGVDVITFEFENIPVRAIEWCRSFCEVRPEGRILHIAQHRLREKSFLSESRIPLARFAAVSDARELRAAAGEIGLPAILKSATFGYDGKGQQEVLPGDDLEALWARRGGEPAVLEERVNFIAELSVIVARGMDGQAVTFPVCRNRHRDRILDITTLPFGDGEVEQEARALAVDVAAKLGLTGLLTVEMFLLEDGRLLVNELAPRPHNSGHFSFDACVTSQFEQQLRAVCGLPLGATDLLSPVAMANLLGDLWENGEPDWAAAAAFPRVKIHLYGKTGPRRGRKMGHLLAFADSSSQAVEIVERARRSLTGARS